ncbi:MULTISPECIES: U32 family peptidase [unclassified Adlercreutzia]|uniref:U32 family peptidase n=1 Tax=unclassified Adlercreutzia TaxID=2636013 RepID=UPI001F14A149|nr:MULTISPECIES: U32 family peptidase [unclassified Adlercreutzia]
MELLAPAGGMEQLRAAVRFGADAVYLAADRFGMRARAANFALADIPEAVAFAHAAGCKVHVTCNVLMGPDDIDALPAYLRALDAAGVDALIIGDLGAFALAREHAPHVDLHVSTQASVANAAAATVWHSLGAKRVVCAREMSLDDIARLRQDAPPDLEIEAFAHGAMCMAVSGRCLISSYLTGRSGNRGHCTQPCRWSYTLEEEKRPGEHFPIEEDGRGTFIMNAKDLNMIEHLDALARVGVDSIKIEGRNKKAFYVATVVGAYRRALDGAPACEVVPELYAVSHRPYGTGFYFGEAEQACAYDGYEQEAMHVADVTGCEDARGAAAAGGVAAARGSSAACGTTFAGDCDSAGSPAREGAAAPFRLLARCRNRFAEGDELEVLSPHAPVRAVRVRSLTWLPDPTEDDPAPAPVPVPVANRSCNAYRFEAEGLEAPVPPGSFLRVRAFRRSARHGQPERA